MSACYPLIHDRSEHLPRPMATTSIGTLTAIGYMSGVYTGKQTISYRPLPRIISLRNERLVNLLHGQLAAKHTTPRDKSV